MSKKSITVLISTVLCIFVFFIGCNSTKIQNQTKDGLKIGNWSASLGGVNENNLEKSKYSYSLSLTNENEKTVFIESIQPLVNDTIKNKVLSKETVVTVNKDIKPNETIEINGAIIFDTKGLSKPDILKLEPFIKEIKVSSEEVISLGN